MPRIVEPSADAVERAAKVLRRGGVVALPTETVYGLGADTFSETALVHVYELKGRPSDNPLIAHVLDAQQARTIASKWDDRCQRLADRFWPGPLTLIVPKAATVPDQATASYATIAVRSPAHPVARDLLAQFGGPISAPSANRSGHVSPTSAQHVADDFAAVEDLLILDGGPCALGIESTVLDMTHATPMVLRPGSVSASQLSDALGAAVVMRETHAQGASPGTASSHYAPRTPVLLVDAAELLTQLSKLDDRAVLLSTHLAAAPPPHALIAMPQNAEQYAAQIYDALRRADAMHVSRIVIERPDDAGGIWDAIRNRLLRIVA